MKKLFSIAFAALFSFAFSQKKWSLRECVDYAEKNNLQVASSRYSKNIQNKNLDIAKKQYLPGVSGTIGNTLSFGQQLVGAETIRNDYFNNTANIGVSVLLYNNGRLEKSIRKANYDVEAADYDLQTIKNNISLQIAQDYLSILLNKEIVKINESTVENTQKQYNRAQTTTKVGTTPQTTLAEAAASLARDKQNLQVAIINVKRSLFSLAQLLQLLNYQNFDIEDIEIPDSLTEEIKSTEDIMNNAYSTLPEIKSAESKIKSSEAQTAITKTAYYPTVTGTAGVGSFYYNSLVTNTVGYDSYGVPIKESDFFKQYKTNFGQQVAVSANIPIFNKGITKLQVEQSKINEELAKNNLEQQKLAVKQNVQKAQFDADANYQTYLASLETEKSTKQALDFAQKSYDAGKTTIYDLNIARNNYTNAQGSVAQAKYNYLFSVKLVNFYAGIPITM